MTRIEADATAAVATRNAARNGNGSTRRPSARARIEAAAAASQAAEAAMSELYANPLIARLDLEGLGCELADEDLIAILTLVRSLEARSPALPQRTPGGNGQQPAPRMS